MKYMRFNIKYISFCIWPYAHAPDVPACLLDELWWDDGPGPPQSCLGDLWAVQIGSLAVVRLVLMPCLWMFNGKGWDPHPSNVVKYHSEHTHMLYIDQEAWEACKSALYTSLLTAFWHTLEVLNTLQLEDRSYHHLPFEWWRFSSERKTPKNTNAS